MASKKIKSNLYWKRDGGSKILTGDQLVLINTSKTVVGFCCYEWTCGQSLANAACVDTVSLLLMPELAVKIMR